MLILQGASYATAEGARQALERRGATVELQAHDVEVPGPEPSSTIPLGLEVKLFIAIIVIIFIAAIFVLSVIPSCPSDWGCGGQCLP